MTAPQKRHARRVPGMPFASFEAFVEYPIWWGLESTIDDLIDFCRNAPDVQAMIYAAEVVCPGGFLSLPADPELFAETILRSYPEVARLIHESAMTQLAASGRQS